MLKPVAVITSLEDSAPSLDRRLLAAYLRTEYRVTEPPGFSFNIGEMLPEITYNWLSGTGCRTWAFLTAWNPGSQPFPIAANRERNRQMAADLDKGGWNYFAGLGIGPDDDWIPEESFWIWNIPAGEAIRLGRRYGQYALVWWEEREVVALWLL